VRDAEIVLEGLALNPEPPAPPPGTRGRIKRSKEHATAFCDLRAVLSSAAKQGRDLLGTLTKLLAAPQELGEDLAKG